ncbi:MAG: RnfABCDGE type electron transport complex subunit B [Oscillospiraceae bacterium]|nr:RnfABCDGE type electron transport complex subunit B [Oscillospiraceae bacterium]
MNEILTAVLTLGGLGLLFGAVLAVSSRLFKVELDDRYDNILKALPGANCGGCGYTGCAAYASAITEGADIDLCPPGGDETIQAIAGIMGVEPVKGKRMTALVKCSGGVRAKKKFEYAGIQDCVAAARIGGGLLECRYGCLGLGTCVSVCVFGAVSIVDGVAVIDYDKCESCGKCVSACPKNIISMIPYEADVHVCCSSADKGAVLRKICEIGCVGCRLCEKVCKHDAIHVNDNLAAIDYDKCTHCGDCAEKCPRKLISDANLDKGPKPVDHDGLQNASDSAE